MAGAPVPAAHACRGPPGSRPLYTPDVTPRLGLLWAAFAAATVLGAAAWLRQPLTGTLVVCAAAAACSLVLAWRGRRGFNRLGFAVCAVIFLVVASRAQRASAADAREPAAARDAATGRATAAMAAAIGQEVAALQRLAAAALDAPTDPTRAFADLGRLRGESPSRAVVLVRDGIPVAWSGRVTLPLDSLPGPVGAVGTRFYLVIYAIAGRGPAVARAETLVHAERPANAILPALDAPLARRFGVDGFAFVDPTAAVRDSFTVVRAAGVPVLGVRAVAPYGEVLAARELEHGRARGGLALAFAVVFLIAAVWRDGARVGNRLAALAVALGVVALVPLSDFSNVSPLFNPAFFFVDAGGPFTASVGALALTCAIVLLGMLAALRGRVGATTRVQALGAVVVIAVIGPFLLGRFARGIQFPAAGVTAAMWLAWEVTLFLAAVSVLLAGATAGQAALGTRRGLPLWIAPGIAAAAALLAPALVNAPGTYPTWYPAVWVLAIAALALARSARGAVLPVAIVAACGAVTLVWGQSVRARVGLAERDVAGLNVADPGAAALLRRFNVQLDTAHAPESRLDLLVRYASSDLASGDYPVELTSWDARGNVMADLRVAMGPGKASGIDYLAREAAGASQPIMKETPGLPGLYLVLSFPHADRSVTTVVVAPRTRLVSPDPFGALIGLGVPPTTDPPYALRRSEAGSGAYISATPQWTRKGTDLHGDWFLPSVGGRVSNVHATVELRGYEALTTRGALVVLLDLAVLALLWLLLVIADGAFGRWMRMRRKLWLGGYRARLTLALFAFFVLPAAAFAAWSYRRLQDDDNQSRDLLVRETLRGMTASPDSVQLTGLADRFETPLFLYANGVLVGTSDPLYDALAPIGRLLPPSAQQALSEGDEITASTEEQVGDSPLRFGFRSVDVTPEAHFVLAAPGRTDDLALDRRRRDLGILVLFATAVGAVAALWLSGLAARQFSRPIRTLQAGALALAAGEREPRLESDPPAEFQPVFSAFRQMARDLEASRQQEVRAQRVLAWGEMARQVAHEIKNPLTPMRLGMQHLRRARNDPRVDFDQVFDENVVRVLAEIDRLDEIARDFSRYGTVPGERTPAEPVDVAQAVQDVVRLEQLGGPAVDWRAQGADVPVFAMASAAELREVLLNLFENSRHAGARHVRVSVARDDGRMVGITITDDGHGIPIFVMPRIFEPHFSTRTSGSGLGLAISRRMIEGWGGSIAVESASGDDLESRTGTIVRIGLAPPAAP
jgi:two-component system nitrogen regulation sensor histidine kinase NtrY